MIINYPYLQFYLPAYPTPTTPALEAPRPLTPSTNIISPTIRKQATLSPSIKMYLPN